jgi:hypothetical protein
MAQLGGKCSVSFRDCPVKEPNFRNAFFTRQIIISHSATVPAKENLFTKISWLCF